MGCWSYQNYKRFEISNYKYSGYGICFDSGGTFTSGNITNGKNVIIFGVDTSSSIHSANKTQNIYLLGKDFIQGINGTTIYAEKIYKTNFTEHSKKFVYTTMAIILIYLSMEFNS